MNINQLKELLLHMGGAAAEARSLSVYAITGGKEEKLIADWVKFTEKTMDGLLELKTDEQ